MSHVTTAANSTRSVRRLIITLSAALGVAFAVLMIAGIGYIIDTFGIGQRASFLPLAIVCVAYGLVGGFIAAVVMPADDLHIQPMPPRRIS